MASGISSFLSTLWPSATDMESTAMRAAANVSKIPHPPHPYYPVEVEIVGYLANDMSLMFLLTTFFGGVAVLCSGAYMIVKQFRPNLPKTELAIYLWFVMCGFIHLFFEGYFAVNYKHMGELQDLFGQLWKEYSLSDSRYLTQDAFVLCMETITAICWGPLSFAVAAMIALDHPLRHPLQVVVSLGQLYGDVLYYATCLFDHRIYNRMYSRPEAYYFYGYFIMMNTFWIIIPFTLMFKSCKTIGNAFRALEKVDATLKRNPAKKLN